MTEQVISIKLTADGAELFETLNAAGNAIARLGQSADGLSQATNSLGDLAGSASGLNALTDAAGRLADATRSFADANREAAQSNDAFASASSVFQSIISGSTEALVGYLLQTSALSAGQGALTSATTGLGDAFKSTTIIVPKLVELSQSQSQAMTGQGAAASSTSSQVQKMSVAYEALTIVLGGLDSSQAAPAIKEIGSASDGTGSKAGSLASFFGGPWGIAIGLGVSVLAPLVGQIFDSGEAAKEAEAKADQYSQSLREMAISARDATRSLEGLARARSRGGRQGVKA